MQSICLFSPQHCFFFLHLRFEQPCPRRLLKKAPAGCSKQHSFWWGSLIKKATSTQFICCRLLPEGEHCCFLLHDSPDTAGISQGSRSPWLRQIRFINMFCFSWACKAFLKKSYFFRAVPTHPSTPLSVSGLLAKDGSAHKAVGACLGEGSAGSSDNQHQNFAEKFSASMVCQRKSARRES